MWALERQYPSQNSSCDRWKWLNQILILHSHKWTIAAGLSAKGTRGSGYLHIIESFQGCLKRSHTQLLYCYKPMWGMAWNVDAGWSKHLPIWLGLKEVLNKTWNGRAQLLLALFYYVTPTCGVSLMQPSFNAMFSLSRRTILYERGHWLLMTFYSEMSQNM